MFKILKRIGIALGAIVIIAAVFILIKQSSYKSSDEVVHIEGEIIIPAEPSKVWKYIAEDFDKIEDYSAGVKKSYYLEGSTIGKIQSQRKCEIYPAGYVDETITKYDQSNYVLEFEVTGGDLPIEMAIGTWELYNVEGGTRVVEKADFRMSYFFMNGLAKENFQLGIHQNLAGLKNLVLNSEKATPENISDIMELYGDM